MKILTGALAAASAITWLSLPLCTVFGQPPAPDESKTAPPSVSYWHVYTDKEGTSYQVKEALRAFELKSIEPPAAPQWLDELKAEGASRYRHALRCEQSPACTTAWTARRFCEGPTIFLRSLPPALGSSRNCRRASV